MNEETTLPAEVPADTESSVVTEPAETEVTEAADGALTEATIYEDLAGAATEETVAEVVITLEDLHEVGNYVGHIDLFGSFLVCGTLVGLALLRDRHGS